MTNQATKVKKRDDEKAYWLIVGGLFTIILLIVDFTYRNLFGMFIGWELLIGIPVFTLHCIIAVGWYAIMTKFSDPDFDIWRKIVVYFSGIAIILIMLHRSGWLDNKQVIIDSNKNKEAAK